MSRSSPWLVAVTLLACMLAVAWTRPRLVSAMSKVKARSDVYALPPPEILERASLGYRSALADYLWAHVLVTQGLRMGERRPFKEIELYLDAINHLDPAFRDPYRITDSLMSFQANDPNPSDSVRRARQILERGLKQFPYDAELWLNYGQFLAYIAPSFFPSGSEEGTAWREAGARALVRAGELGATDDSLAFRSMSAATILTKAGELDAAIRFMERLYAMTENEEAREDIARRLNGLRQGRVASREFEFAKAFESLWRNDLPFAPRTRLSVLGPPVDSWQCAGPLANRDDKPCDRSWSGWTDHALRGKGGVP